MVGVGALALVGSGVGCAKGSLPLPQRQGLPTAGSPFPQSGGASGGGGVPSLPAPGAGSPAGLPSPGGGGAAGLPSSGLPSPGLPSAGGGASSGAGDQSGDATDGADSGGAGSAGTQTGADAGEAGAGRAGTAGTETGGTETGGAETGWDVSTELPDVAGGAGDNRDGAAEGDSTGGAGENPDGADDGIAGGAAGDGETAQDPSKTDDALAQALEDFDEGLLKERLEAARQAETAGAVDGAPQVAQDGSAHEGGDQTGTAGGGKGNVGRPPATAPGPPPPPTPDTPDARDEDVVARQIREAAEKETDPELKELLWQEYERYKAGL